MKAALFRISMALAGAASLAGCAAQHAHKGAVIDAQLASSVQPGVDNKASVEKLLGRPSFTGEFTPNDWYYVSRDTQQSRSATRGCSSRRYCTSISTRPATSRRSQRTGKELVMNVAPSKRKHADARPPEELLRGAVRRNRHSRSAGSSR